MTPILILFLGVLVVLSVATATSEILIMRKGPSQTLENLQARVRSWWGMILILATALALGPLATVLFFAGLSFAALRELTTISMRQKADHMALAASFFLIIPIQFLSIYQNWYGFYTVFIPVYAFLGLSTLAVLRGMSDNFLTRIAHAQWNLMAGVFCISHIPALLFLDYPSIPSVGLIVFLVMVVQGSDILQYVWGKLIGKRKIAPTLSPNKTWEGFVGGAITASLLGTGLYWLTPFTPVETFFMGLVITTAGFFGGLVMSAIKRDRGIKDWSHLIEGHGGIMDRLDSLVFAAPLFFHLTRFFWT